jgi:hypothetical protein
MTNQPLLQKEQIIQNLILLGDELEALQITRPVCLLMIGGAYMLTQVGNRLFTEDVDVFARIDKHTEDYRRFRAAIHFIADDTHVSQKWISDNMSDFLQMLGPVPQGKPWLRHTALLVSVPEPQYILVLKLLAGREKDIADIQTLCEQLRLVTIEQAEIWLAAYVKTYQMDEQMVEDRRENIDQILRIALTG